MTLKNKFFIQISYKKYTIGYVIRCNYLKNEKYGWRFNNMSSILALNKIIGDFVWGWPMLIMLLGTGLFLGIRTKFVVVRKFGYVLKNTLLKMFDKNSGGEGEISAFQAVSTALAATVGTGNIAGVALAIAVGGPGAVFWMWLSAVLGMSTKFAEVILAVTYRVKEKDSHTYSGGPMYYIERGLGQKWLAKIFALFGALASLGTGNMTQSNSIAQSLNAAFNVDMKVVGIVLTVLTAVVVLGGIKRIGQVTEKFVPLMAAFYIVGAIAILFINASEIPHAFGLIFGSAFSGHAAVGGFAGSTLMLALRNGVARGVFTNEAGLGSAPIAHAAATTDHPVRQGLWGVFEVFVDTLVICTMTALVILVSGQWTSGLQGAALTTKAFQSGFSGGQYIVSIGLTLFAFSTILGWSYYGEKCTQYLFGEQFVKVYRLIYIPLVFVGSIGGLQAIWAISDTVNGLMALPNLVGLLFLSGVIIAMVKDFFKDPDRIRKTEEEYLAVVPEKFKPKDLK